MNTLDKQLKGIIENSISKTMNIKIPVQYSEQEKNILFQLLREQTELKQRIILLNFSIESLRSDIAVIKHYHEYNC